MPRDTSLAPNNFSYVAKYRSGSLAFPVMEDTVQEARLLLTQTRIPRWSAPLGNWEKLGAQQPRIRTQKGRQPYCMNSLRKMHHKLSRSTCFPPPPWLGHECPQSSVHLAGHLPKHVRVVYKCKFLQMAYEWAPAESQPACGIGRKHHQSPTTGKTSRRISAPGLAL